MSLSVPLIALILMSSVSLLKICVTLEDVFCLYWRMDDARGSCMLPEGFPDLGLNLVDCYSGMCAFIWR